MYKYITEEGLISFLKRETIPVTISIVLVELFFKVHSFTLETLAFLSLWYLISGAMGYINRADN